MGVEVYVSGNSVVFKGSFMLYMVVYEVVHIVQQWVGVSFKGGVGVVGDQYEIYVDFVVDLVVQGKSVEGLLDIMVGSGGSVVGLVQM